MAGERTVRELVERERVLGAAPDTTVAEAAARMAREACGSILVMSGERLAGIFTERDLLVRVIGVGRDPRGVTLGEVMTRDPDTIAADAPIADAIRMMDEFSYRYLPVLDDKTVMGVLSMRHLPFADVIGMQGELGMRHALQERMR